MSLRVKKGREYVFGGKVYKAGEIVEGVPDKYVKILTLQKGPLELARGGTAKRTVDLPAKALKPAKVVEPEPQLDPEKQAAPMPDYIRKDITAGN